MSSYGQSQDAAYLEDQNKAAWAAYQALPCAPGWQQRSIDAATAAARAKLALDTANGYRR